jgi:hypothetical protein
MDKTPAETQPVEISADDYSSENSSGDSSRDSRASHPRLDTRLPDGEFAIGGIDLFTTELEVIERFGEPDSRTGFRGTASLNYPNTTVYLHEDGGVNGLSTTDVGVCTPSGICVGQSLESVFERLGPADTYEDENGSPHALYLPPESANVVACWMEVGFEGSLAEPGAVRELAIACQP